MSTVTPLASMTPDEIDNYILEFEAGITDLTNQRNALDETHKGNEEQLKKMNVQLDAMIETHRSLLKLRSCC